MSVLLRCPHCDGALAATGPAWRCPAGHSFDVARQGYVNLTAGQRRHTGDTSRMLDARTAVLDAGHLAAVTDAVVDACSDGLPSGALVEMGAGTGHHLAHVRRALGPRRAVAIDASVAAAKRAARADPEWLTAVVADAWQPWPLLDGVAAAVLTIFAPRNPFEAARVLAPDGYLITVTPCADHLAELTAPLGLPGIEPGKLHRLHAAVQGHLALADSREVRSVRVLDRDEARTMAAMGPAGHHDAAAELDARAARLPHRVRVTIAVRVSRFRHLGSPGPDHARDRSAARARGGDRTLA